MFIDSHAHFDRITQDTNIDNNISRSIHISLHPEEFLKNYPLLSQNKKILFATGIYPDYTANSDFNEQQDLTLLEKVLTEYPHIALGEAGIDLKDSSYGSLKNQTSLFEQQIDLAEKLHLPIIIHSRFSFNECFHSLKKYNTKAIMHCFSYTIKEMEQTLQRGDYISFAGILTYKSSLELQQAAQIIPLNKVLFETDSPYLSPVPVRNKSNIPNHVQYTYEYFAQLRNISIEELCSIVSSNFSQAFNI